MRTVARIAKEDGYTAFGAGLERRRRPVGRPSVAAPFRGFVASVLRSLPDVPTCEVLDLARQRGYRGGKTAFYDMVARLRPHVARDRRKEKPLTTSSTTA